MGISKNSFGLRPANWINLAVYMEKVNQLPKQLYSFSQFVIGKIVLVEKEI